MAGINLPNLQSKLTVDLSGLDKAAAEAGSKAQSIGSKISDALSGLKGVALAAGGAIAAGIAVGINTNLNLETSRQTVQAQLGTTAEESKRLGGIAGTLYAQAYGSSIQEVGQAVRFVIQNIQDMETASSSSIQDVSAKVLDLAQAFEADLGQATRAVDQLMRTGLATSAENALDIITRGFQSGTDEAGDLLDTISEYSTQFRKLGLDGPTAIGLLNQGLRAGARDADTVADALKEFAIRAIDGSTATLQGFAAIGLGADKAGKQVGAASKDLSQLTTEGKNMVNALSSGGPQATAALQTVLDRIKNMHDPTQREAAAVALFGTKAEDLGSALFALDPSHATQALGEVGGAADKLDKTLSDTTENKLEAFKRKMESIAGAAVNLPGGLGTASAAILTYGSSAVAVIAPLSTMIATQRLAAATAKTTAATQATSANVGALAMIRANVSAVASAVAMRVSLIGIWLSIQAQAIGAAVKTGAAWVAQGVVAAASSVAAAASVVASWLAMAAAAIANAVVMAAAWLIALGPIAIVVALVIAAVVAIILQWDNVKNATLAVWGAIVAFFQYVWQLIVSVVTTYINIVKAVIDAVWNAIVAAITIYLNTVKAVYQAVWSAIVAVVTGYVNTIKAVLNWFAGLGSMFSGWFSAAKNAAVSAIGGLVDFMRSLPGKITGALGNVGSLLYNIGKDIINGLVNGVKAAAGAVADAVRAIVDKIPGPIRKLMHIESPSKVMREIGQFITMGLALGMTDGLDLVSAASLALGNASIPDMVPRQGGVATPGGASSSTSTSNSLVVNMRNGATAGEVVNEFAWRYGGNG